MTSFNDLAAARYSVRSFKAQSVEKEKEALIIEAGRAAPTAKNLQPQRIKVITGDDLLKVDACTPCRFGAPLVFMVCYDTNVCWVRSFDKAKSGQVDASIVTTHMLFAAQDLGLGTVWVMHFDPAKAIEEFKLPENIIPVALLPVGYISDEAKPGPMHEVRQGLDITLF